MKPFIIACLCTIMFMSSNAQNVGTNYKTALGVKVYPGAITAKHFLSNNTAIEGLGYIYSDGFRLTGLYELHYDLGNVEGLKWYLGGGAHIGIGNDNWRKIGSTATEQGFTMGIDGVLGVDYKIKGAPLNLSFDWQPSFNLIGNTNFEASWGGLGIRYTF